MLGEDDLVVGVLLLSHATPPPPSPYSCLSHFDEIMAQDLWYGCGQIEQEVLGAELGNHTKLLHQELGIVESGDKHFVYKVFCNTA